MDAYERVFTHATEDSAGRGGFEVSALREAVFDAARTRWLASPVADFCLRLGLGSPTSLLSDFPGPSEELAFLRTWAPTYRQDAWTAGLGRVAVGDVGLASELAAAFRVSLRSHCAGYDDALPALEQVARFEG